MYPKSSHHKAVEIKHEHRDLGINIIVESVKAIEEKEAEEQATFEGEVIREASG